jgi:lysophospholipase L1-like esterase
VTVGIAQRVEQAIAALATKPDPKIVTLQLDELDGVRLTVALRPDGIHLSSTGEASLTADIERALASRGFDMASGSRQQDGRTAQDRQDDGWKPQAAGRRRRTDQPGITL